MSHDTARHSGDWAKYPLKLVSLSAPRDERIVADRNPVGSDDGPFVRPSVPVSNPLLL